MAARRCWPIPLLLLSFACLAEECANIWPRAVTEYASTPASVSYSPPNPVTINSFNRSLGPGDYQIGSHSIPNGTVLTTSGATTRIFVNGSLTLNNNVMLNASGPPENLLIVVTGSLSVFNNSVIRGFVVVGGAVFFSNNASINGGLTAKGPIDGWNNSNATYNASALTRLNGGVVCSGQPAPEQIDHFEFSYTGQALTCKPETFTVKACKNAACSELITSNVSATLSPASGWISGTGLTGGNTINFSGGTATATLSQTTAATIAVGVSASTPSLKSGSTTLCQIGASLPAANCNVVFSSSGLLFSVPDKTAGKPATGILVKAVKSDGSQQCVPSFANVSRTVRFWSAFNNPVTPSASPLRAVSVSNGGAYTNIGTTAGTATALSLSFNSDGEASIGVNYSDAGQVTLNAVYNGSVATNDLNLTMSGADQFVSAPAGLCITAQQYCATANATCTGYVKAGESFPLDIKAVGWASDVDTNFCDNTTTPSFQLSGINLSSSLVQPSGGASGSLSPSSYNHSAAATATTTVNASQSEVGVFNLAASYSGSYLGMPLTLTSSMTSPLGRIVPHHFSLTSSSLPASCGVFNYFEQPAALSFTLKAQNASGSTVVNYRGDFAKATATLVAENNNDGVDRSSRLNNQSILLSWTDGETKLTGSPVYVKRETSPDGPFSQLRIGLKLSDNDDLDAQLLDLDQRVDSNTNCSVTGDCSSKMLTTSDMDWRYGRLQIVNALGSEQSNLPVQLKAEYWNGSQFVPNNLDSCTAITPSKLLITTGTNPVITASGNSTTLNQGSSAAFDLLLSHPGIESRYPLQYQLDDAPWLQYNWEPDDAVLLENPRGEAVFGGFRGNNRQIFWQEN